MSSGLVGGRIPAFRKDSSASSGGLRTRDSKDVNSLHNTTSGIKNDEGNGNAGNKGGLTVGRGSFRDPNGGGSSRTPNMIEEIPVYIGERNIVLTTTNQNPRSVTNGNGPPYRRCCFFWTCCCRCSCLNVKSTNPDSNKEHPFDLLNGENEPMPSIDEIRSWGESFDKLMKSSVGRKMFSDFLKCEYSEENILFWQACEDLKREHNSVMVEERARLIYEDFISILSPKEVSLDSRVREIINQNMVVPTTHTFDEAQTQIYTLMHRDSYPRFINSAHYKRLARLNNNGSRATTASGPLVGAEAGSNTTSSSSATSGRHKRESSST